MNTLSKLNAGVASAALGLAMLAGPAFAQTAPEAPAADAPAAQPPQEIVVTGTRITRVDLQASSPVDVITDEKIKAVNTVTVEQILSVNPQFAPGTNGASNNPGDGAATIDLRGLGAKRTLVLMDGKRLPFYDSTGAVDVNQIPTVLLKNIQVLTGGASAVYGSDAISGVVNFVLDDKFTGFKVDGGAQVTGQGDGATYDVSGAAGFKIGDRGHFTIAANWSKRDGVKFGQRSFSNSVLCSGDNVSFCGSSNTTPTAFDIPGAGRQQVTASGGLTSNVQGYNYNPVNYAQVPLERYGATALWNYDITDAIELYGRAMYQHTKVVTTLAPTATAGFSFNIDPSNPLLSAAEREAFFDTTANPNLVINSDGTSTVGIRRRIVETGGRVEEHTSKTWQVMSGLRGDLGWGFKWDASVQYAEVHKYNLLENDLSYSALTDALDVIAGPNGQAECRSAAARTAGCQPLNLFGTAPLSAASLAYVLRNATEADKTSQLVAEGNISGDVGFLQSPLAAKPAAISVGVDYRRETADTEVNDAYASGDLIYYGQGYNIPNKSYNVKEAYLEFHMPLVQDKPLIQALNFEAGYRYSHYSTAGGVSAYKFGGDWSPVLGLKFRGNYQRAVRAPNLYELYLPRSAGTGNLGTDPCAGTSVSATVAAICVAQGAPQSAIGHIPEPISGQINAFYGGNANLKAENANTITFGTVIEPTQIRGLALTVDYYDIKIANAIVYEPTSVTMNQCFSVEQDPNGSVCKSIVRNPLDGSLSGDTTIGVPALYNNVAVMRTRGFDFGFNFRRGRHDDFHYALDFQGTYQITNYQIVNSTTIQCAGKFGADCDTPSPKWKHVASVTFGWKPVEFTTRWRMIGATSEDSSTNILTARIPAVHYFDETVNFNVEGGFGITVGMLNVFDKTPPIIGDTSGATSAAGSTFPTTYDVLGRTMFIRASKKF
ncbi:TonB-dependent receptor domain-containing protein [Novosphingobium sp. Fuku2-ISO-50]|uniref:TonB-dependent receptor domain-containing protein n=1 Tax=Novosphingobium sp. Fuku2-ISO-50 TaxID=1739114 RepID=UPI00076BDBF9|nr:TonB-dependent receptor [Novosphingobium sp. Fuku2-ISO-50]KUR77267.1 hypothetical protein AQZ50_10605 [Novosphingobium sp. Fuku2-ISO-50]